MAQYAVLMTWWRHQMEAKAQKPMTRSFDVFFDLCLNKRLSKQSRRRWFETPSRSLWRHCNGQAVLAMTTTRCGRVTWLWRLNSWKRMDAYYCGYRCPGSKAPCHQYPRGDDREGHHMIYNRYAIMTSSNGNIFHVTDALWGESTGYRWIPLTKTSDAELWCFLWSAPEQTVKQTMETLVIWDAIVLMMTSL